MKIGILDSGAGGLTILNAIRQKSPALDLIYLADESFAPYGEKSPEQIQSRLIKIGAFFEAQHAKAIVVACNTATVVAIEALRASTHLPVIGVEPAVKPACRVSKKRHVAVLATPLTAKSERLKELIDRWREDSQVNVMSSPTLAFAIDGWPESQSKVIETVECLCRQMLEQEVDTLVLACTHYPLVKNLFEMALGPNCEIIEPNDGVVAQLIRRLDQVYSDEAQIGLSSESFGQIALFSTQGTMNMDRLTQWIEDSASICQKEYVLL
ncbi:Glutamate racemase 2 [Marinomonas spartinae]|uniref:glutamate racemase n=1 Tax=Marinomonas spartinae TaxID=1792290 RepID=UPI000808A373|nr:glutamate racemase [Marinomonas spartinae]SBS37643.1 Glutamate racemase 2 [Marinomonas spartinae]